MDGGAHDFVVNQATQLAYSLVKEGRELAGVDSLSLGPYIAQLGGFRIESKGGVAKIDRQVAQRAVRYVKSNSRTQEENPEEYLSIHPDSGLVVLSGKELDLNVPAEDRSVRRVMSSSCSQPSP